MLSLLGFWTEDLNFYLLNALKCKVPWRKAFIINCIGMFLAMIQLIIYYWFLIVPENNTREYVNNSHGWKLIS